MGNNSEQKQANQIPRAPPWSKPPAKPPDPMSNSKSNCLNSSSSLVPRSNESVKPCFNTNLSSSRHRQSQVNTIVQKQYPIATSSMSNRSTPSLPQARILVQAPVIINKFNNATALLDSGASSCFITSTYCESNGIEILQTSKDYTITGYNDESSSTHSIAMFNIELNNITWNMSAIVLPVLPTCDMILGMNWFEIFDPIINWRHKTVQLDPLKFSFPASTSDMIIASFHVIPNTSLNNITHCKTCIPTPITFVQPNVMNEQQYYKLNPPAIMSTSSSSTIHENFNTKLNTHVPSDVMIHHSSFRMNNITPDKDQQKSKSQIRQNLTKTQNQRENEKVNNFVKNHSNIVLNTANQSPNSISTSINTCTPNSKYPLQTITSNIDKYQGSNVNISMTNDPNSVHDSSKQCSTQIQSNTKVSDFRSKIPLHTVGSKSDFFNFSKQLSGGRHDGSKISNSTTPKFNLVLSCSNICTTNSKNWPSYIDSKFPAHNLRLQQQDTNEFQIDPNRPENTSKCCTTHAQSTRITPDFNYHDNMSKTLHKNNLNSRTDLEVFDSYSRSFNSRKSNNSNRCNSSSNGPNHVVNTSIDSPDTRQHLVTLQPSHTNTTSQSKLSKFDKNDKILNRCNLVIPGQKNTPMTSMDNANIEKEFATSKTFLSPPVRVQTQFSPKSLHQNISVTSGPNLDENTSNCCPNAGQQVASFSHSFSPSSSRKNSFQNFPTTFDKTQNLQISFRSDVISPSIDTKHENNVPVHNLNMHNNTHMSQNICTYPKKCQKSRKIENSPKCQFK